MRGPVIPGIVVVGVIGPLTGRFLIRCPDE